MSKLLDALRSGAKLLERRDDDSFDRLSNRYSIGRYGGYRWGSLDVVQWWYEGKAEAWWLESRDSCTAQFPVKVSLYVSPLCDYESGPLIEYPSPWARESKQKVP